ncbi:MAG: tyrosine-type recombinase/integrase [Candidatus Nanohaloarchaea archaeon]
MPSQDKDLFSIAESLETNNDPIQYKKFAEYHNGEKADGTLVQYLRYLSHLDFDPTVNDPEPSTVEVENFDLTQFKRWATLKAKKRDVDTTRFKYNTYVALKSYLEAVGETSKIRQLPESRNMEKPSSQSPTTYFTEEQVQKILEAVSDNNPQLKQAIIHMFYAGMRSYEILNLKPDWYEFTEDEAIEIEIPSEYAKGKKNSKEPEYCFLPARFQKEIQNYIINQHETEIEDFQGFIQETDSEDLNHLFDFIGDSDKDFRALARERYHLNKELEKVAEKSGINKAEKISAHRLRKSFIHHIYEGGEEGLNLSRTSNLARHQNTDLTDKHYLNIEKKENKQDYQKVMG